MRKAIIAAALLAGLTVSLPAAQRPAGPDFEASVAAPGRPKERVALDEVRKPAEVLRFMGLKRGDRALDYFTGTGYYAEIMARAVGPKGVVVGWNTPPFQTRVKEQTDAVGQRNPNAVFYATPATAIAFPPRSFDFVMLHLVYHDAYWESAEFKVPRIDPGTVVRAIWDATRPGGTVAVIDHVGKAGIDTRELVGKLHRIDPAVVRSDFERAGFVLEAQSYLLRVPEDDLTKNVFDPSIRGRTDRFMYRFRKPAR